MNAKHFQHGIISVSAAYFALLPQFYQYTNAETRFNISWNWADLGAIASAVCILAAVFFTVFALTRRLLKRAAAPVAGLAATWAICVLFLRCVKSIAVRSGHVGGTAESLLASPSANWILYLALPAILLVLWRSKAVRLTKRVGTFAGILPLAFFLTGMTWHTYPKIDDFASLTEADIPVAAIAPAPHDIILCVFDEWSYDRTFPGGAIRADMPNLQRFASEATVFTQASSAGSETHVSMPRLIFQRDTPYTQMPYGELTKQVYALNTPNGPSIFAEATNHFRIILAFHVPYPMLVTNDIDYSIYVPFMDSGVTFFSRMEMLLLSQLDFLRKTSLFGSENVDRMRQVGGAFRLRVLISQFEAAIRLPRVNLFILAHFPIPHHPHIWDKGGLLEAGRQTGDGDPLGYEGNLRYTDELIGNFLEEIKRAGRYANALIVLTSDHAWRYDPDALPFDKIIADREINSPFRHVPLFIKFPGQEQGATNRIPFSTLSLYPIIADSLMKAQ